MADERAPRLREVKAHEESALRAIAELHTELLHFGPISQLGAEFVKEVYRIHFGDGLLRGAVYEVGNRPAGFVAYTDRSVTFHRSSLKAHWWTVGWALLRSMLREPWRVMKLGRAIGVVRSRRGEGSRLVDPLGEVVCIAVRPEYLSRGFVRETGVQMSEALIRYALDDLSRTGVKKVRMLVDGDNKAPLFLYHRLGARIEKYEQAGEPVAEVWFDLDQPDEAV